MLQRHSPKVTDEDLLGSGRNRRNTQPVGGPDWAAREQLWMASKEGEQLPFRRSPDRPHQCLWAVASS